MVDAKLIEQNPESAINIMSATTKGKSKNHFLLLFCVAKFNKNRIYM